MASYTEISREALERFLIIFDLGELDNFSPIADGIENSNYFVELHDSELQYVLTITEDLDFTEVPFFNELLNNLASAGLPVPEPQRTLDGMPSTIFKGKPTWLFNRLAGKHLADPDEAQCRDIGVALASIHTSLNNPKKINKYSRGNVYDEGWARATLDVVGNSIDRKDLANLTAVVADYEKLHERHKNLPKGIIHGDLFRDNALFSDGELTGVIDFYHACEDYLIQDIAITINDWCLRRGLVETQKLDALLAGYESIRKLETAEQEALVEFRRFAAMRFTLTRLLAGRMDSSVKNPREFLHVLDNLS